MKKFGLVVFVFSTLLAVSVLGYGKVRSIQFEQNCSGYLKRASDANTIELARQELAKAVEYLEQNQLTTGSTHMLYETPDCDLGFWYTNLKASLNELESTPSDADRLTVSNQLIKLRETILDQHEKGTAVTRPPNVHVYPHQLAYRTLGTASTLGLLISSISLVAYCEDRKKPCAVSALA